MGLGLFIAKTLLERTGRPAFARQRRSPGKRRVVRVEWPRELIDIDQPEAESEPDDRSLTCGLASGLISPYKAWEKGWCGLSEKTHFNDQRGGKRQ